MCDSDELLVHTDDLSMQSALGFYSNGSFACKKDKGYDAFDEYVKRTKTGKLMERAGMLGDPHTNEHRESFPPRKTEDNG